jgi:hypothetical protein
MRLQSVDPLAQRRSNRSSRSTLSSVFLTRCWHDGSTSALHISHLLRSWNMTRQTQMEDDSKYLTVVHPYPPNPNLRLPADRRTFALWLACCTGKDVLRAMYHKPTVSFIEFLDTTVPNFTDYGPLMRRLVCRNDNRRGGLRI